MTSEGLLHKDLINLEENGKLCGIKNKHYRLNVSSQNSPVKILLPPQSGGIRKWGLREVIRIR